MPYPVPPIVCAEDYGVFPANSGAANTAALNALIASLPDGGEIIFGSPSLTFDAGVLCNIPSMVFSSPMRTTLSFPVLGTGVSAITVSASNVSFLNIIFKGPAGGVYVNEENGINCEGASTLSRYGGIRVRDCEFYNFGYAGFRAKFVDNISFEGNICHNCGVFGALFFSCDNGLALNNEIHDITPGQSANMYGVSWTINQNGVWDPAVNPYCSGWVVEGNYIYNVAWQGIDTHGFLNSRIANNRTFNCKQGISVTTGSNGGAQNYGAEFCTIIGNECDGGPVYANQDKGLTLQGGSTVSTHGLTVVGNIVRRHGATNALGSAAIHLDVYHHGSTISGNVIEDFGGVGMVLNIGAKGINVSGNVFGSIASSNDTYGYCIYVRGSTAGMNAFIGNTCLQPQTRPKKGLVFDGTFTERQHLSGNKFYTSGTPFVPFEAANTRVVGADLTPACIVQSVGGAVLVSLEEYAPSPVIEVTFSSLSGNISNVAFDKSLYGQRLILVNLDASRTVTLTNVGLGGHLAGGAVTLNRYDSICLENNYQGGTWIETARSIK